MQGIIFVCIVCILALGCKEPEITLPKKKTAQIVIKDSLLVPNGADRKIMEKLVMREMIKLDSEPTYLNSEFYLADSGKPMNSIKAIKGLMIGNDYVYIVLVGTTSEEGGSHACPGILSWFEIKKCKGDFEITKSYVGKVELGSNGEIGDGDVCKVGPSKLAGVVTNEYMAQGFYCNTNTYIYDCGDSLQLFAIDLNVQEPEFDTYEGENFKVNVRSMIDRFDVGDSMYVFKETRFGLQNSKPSLRVIEYRHSGKKYVPRNVSYRDTVPVIYSIKHEQKG
jgi:hypothetical protein